MGPEARQGPRRRRADHGKSAPARAEGNPCGAAAAQGLCLRDAAQATSICPSPLIPNAWPRRCAMRSSSRTAGRSRSAGAFSARLMKVTEETTLALRTYAEDILTELRATDARSPPACRRASRRDALALRTGPGRERDRLPAPARPRARGISVFRRSGCRFGARKRDKQTTRSRRAGFVPYRSLHSNRVRHGPKNNPLKLNPLQLRTLTLLQVLAHDSGGRSDRPGGGRNHHQPLSARARGPFPSGRCGRDGERRHRACSIEAVWHALDRKGLARADWPQAVTLTPAGLAYDTGDAREHPARLRSLRNWRRPAFRGARYRSLVPSAHFR